MGREPYLMDDGSDMGPGLYLVNDDYGTGSGRYLVDDGSSIRVLVSEFSSDHGERRFSPLSPPPRQSNRGNE